MSTNKYNKLKNVDFSIYRLTLKDIKSESFLKNDLERVFALDYKDATILTGQESDETLKTLLSRDINTIIFSNCFLSEEFYTKVAKLLENKQTKVLFSVNEESENSDCIFNEEQTKKLASNVNIFLSKGIDAQIYSEVNAQTYPLDKVLDANRKLHAWANLINSARVDGRELSPLEKYLYAFVTVSNYFDYSMEREDENPSVSRALVNVLTGDRIVCVGFAELLSSVLNMVGVPCIRASVLVESAKTGHAVCLPYINDEIYNCNGIIYSDPTSKNLAYSMMPLKDFGATFGNISFVKNGLGSVGKKQLLESYLQSIKGFSEEDYSLIKKLIEENVKAPKTSLTLEEIGKENYDAFLDIVKKVLTYKELTQDEINFVMKYNFQNIKAFKQEVSRASKMAMFLNQKNYLEEIVNRVLFNSKRAVYRSKHRRDNSIIKLSTTVNFSEDALVNVFRSMGKTKETARKFATALIGKAIEELALSEDLLNPTYKLNLNAETSNFFVQTLKSLKQAAENSESIVPITFEEATKAYYETRIGYKVGKITKKELEEVEKKLNDIIDRDNDVLSAKAFIKEEVQRKVMNKGSGKE